MVKHTQTFHRPLPTNCWSVIDHFVELVLKRLKLSMHLLYFRWMKSKTRKTRMRLFDFIYLLFFYFSICLKIFLKGIFWKFVRITNFTPTNILTTKSQKILKFIFSTLERWKAELILDPVICFEHGTAELRIQLSW